MLEKNKVVGPFQCNCRILACAKTGEAVVIDPGDQAAEILAEVASMKTPSGFPIQVKYLLHTHAHLDHIGATRGVKEGLIAQEPSNVPKIAPKIALHRADQFIYEMLEQQGERFGFQYSPPLPIDLYLQDEQELRVGSLHFSMIHTPGHSPGGMCFRLHEDTNEAVKETVYTGDTLFKHSIGRTDLWGGDTDLLLKSIHQRLMTLDGDTRVCPGHGASTFIHEEKSSNPFLN